MTSLCNLPMWHRGCKFLGILLHPFTVLCVVLYLQERFERLQGDLDSLMEAVSPQFSGACAAHRASGRGRARASPKGECGSSRIL